MSDPLDDLRRAWRADAPLPRALETGALEDCDPATRASVEWLRAAHRARAEKGASTSVPPQVQLAHARARRRAARHPLRRAASVAAGLAAAAALLWIARVFDVPRPDDEPLHVAEHEAPRDAPRTTEIPPERFRSRDDGIELVSGSVRIVLLTNHTSGPDEREER